MAKRVCSTPGCPALTDKPRCPEHRREHEQARGSRHERGYGSDHAALREQWALVVATGHVRCWRCHTPLAADQPWHLGHDDNDRSQYRGPECVPCNTATSTRRAG